MPNSALAANISQEKTAVYNIIPTLANTPAHRMEMSASIGPELLSVSPDFLSRSLLFHIFFSCAHTYLHLVIGALKRQLHTKIVPCGFCFAQQLTVQLNCSPSHLWGIVLACSYFLEFRNAGGKKQARNKYEEE